MLKLPPLADGAMGTLLLNQGFSGCLENLNLTHPEVIKDIHHAYIKAGAGLILTHSFGANRWRLKQARLERLLEKINIAAVANARAAAKTNTLVAGCIGPSGLTTADLALFESGTLQAGFAEQAKILAQAGVDLLILETFTHFEELLLAVSATAAAGLPVIAGFAPQNTHQLFDGTPITQVIARLSATAKLLAFGINCTDPATLAEVINAIKPLTALPILAKPNAGRPQHVGTQLKYPLNAEMFAEQSSDLFKIGATCVGGCCGTTPEMINMLHTRTSQS